MKLLKFSLPFLALLITFTSCDIFGDDDDDFRPDISPGNLPVDVRDFVDRNYSGYDVEDADLEDYCDDDVIEVELEDGPGPDIDLYFTLSGEFLLEAWDISVDDLPDAVITAIETEFPDYRIDDDDDDDDAERFRLADGGIQYEVDLDRVDGSGPDLEVVFNEDGSVFCSREDDDDDDDDDDDYSNGDYDDDDGDDEDDLPGQVRSFIADNFPGYEIEDVEKEDDYYLCDDDTEMYEVELEDGPGPDIDLYFSLDWEFRFSVIYISEDDLPAAVLATIESDFPDYEIEDDDIEQIEFPDGSLQFEVELDPDDGDDIEVIFDENGGIVCRED